eukprot:GILK01003672.1.p1 GENE.GILK01003672.1~~GILK01003672.1.p1  ORF type:complete len:270 (-),score=8.86 GILK01003672.1:176-985(-)
MMASRSAGMQMRPASTGSQVIQPSLTKAPHSTVSPRPLQPPQARTMHPSQSYSEQEQQQHEQPPYGPPPHVQIPPHAPVFQEVRHLVGGLGHVVELLWAGQQSVHMLSHSTGHLGHSLLSLPSQLWNIVKAILTFRYLRDLASGSSSKLVSSSSANTLDAIYHGSIGSTGMAVGSTPFLTTSSSSLSRIFSLLNRFVVPLGLIVIVTLLIREKRRLQRALARERLERQSKQTDTSEAPTATAPVPPQLVSDSHAAGPALLSAPRRTSIQ